MKPAEDAKPENEAATCLASARETMASVQSTMTTCQDILDQSQNASDTADLDEKWGAFQQLFETMQTQLVNSIGSAIQTEGINGSKLNEVAEDQQSKNGLSDEDKEAVLNYDFSRANVAKTIKSFVGHGKKIIVMAGAGMSVSAGIPDFRTPGTGLYSTIHKYNLPDLPTPEHLFAINYFRENPMPFTLLANTMIPGNFKPTPTHAFIKLLAEKSLLARLYTQNIDTLELLADIPEDLTVFAHGSYADVHCIGGNHRMKLEDWRASIEQVEPPRCAICDTLVKPDIVFFGESLPSRYAELCEDDLHDADMLIIIGTSLVVSPFCNLVKMVVPTTPRVLINMEAVGGKVGLRYEHPDNYRDVFLEGSCDEEVMELCKDLGWSSELDAIIHAQNAKSFDGWQKVVDAQAALDSIQVLDEQKRRSSTKSKKRNSKNEKV